MARNQSIGNSENILKLTKTVSTCHYGPIDVNFMPLNRYFKINLRSNNVFESILPRYNLDKSYFTPAFCLTADQVPQ